MAEAPQVVVDLALASMAIENAKRTFLCNPEHESRLVSYADALGIGGIVTVIASPGCPIGRIYMFEGTVMVDG